MYFALFFMNVLFQTNAKLYRHACSDPTLRQCMPQWFHVESSPMGGSTFVIFLAAPYCCYLWKHFCFKVVRKRSRQTKDSFLHLLYHIFVLIFLELFDDEIPAGNADRWHVYFFLFSGVTMILVEPAMEAGLPKGVLNIVHGTNVSPSIHKFLEISYSGPDWFS
jgi:hypothetical protein